MRLAFSISHKPTPERVVSLAYMRDAIKAWPIAGIFVEEQPGKPHEWSERQWYGALTFEDATHCVLLNDDLELCADFVPTLTKALEARPNHIVHLGNAGPEPKQADQLAMHWATSTNGLVGNGYAMPRAVLADLMRWRSEELKPGAVEAISEDFLVNLYAMARGSYVQHCVPALYSLPPFASCYGNDLNWGRQCSVLPRTGMLDIDWSTDAVHAGRIKATEAYTKAHYRLITSLRTPLVERYFACAGE